MTVKNVRSTAIKLIFVSQQNCNDFSVSLVTDMTKFQARVSQVLFVKGTINPKKVVFIVYCWKRTDMYLTFFYGHQLRFNVSFSY